MQGQSRTECLNEGRNNIFMQRYVISYELVLGGIPVHTEYRCLFFLRYEFFKYRNTGVI